MNIDKICQILFSFFLRGEVIRQSKVNKGKSSDVFLKTDFRIIFFITGPPEILMRPQSQHVKAGGIASFYCRAHGAPTPQIHWRKNGKKVSCKFSVVFILYTRKIPASLLYNLCNTFVYLTFFIFYFFFLHHYIQYLFYLRYIYIIDTK